MKPALRIFGGIVAAVLALLLFVLGVLAATLTQHTLREDERTHLQAANEFLRSRHQVTGVIPDNLEFEAWSRAMDAKGYRFEGNGFTLDRRCGPKVSDFCIYFSTGNGFVTYKSWQQSMEKVSLDDSPLPLALGLLVTGLMAAVICKLLLVPRAAHTSA